MPLFECSKCHVAENTALSNFWWEVGEENNPALCSQCDPEIKKWHDRFPRTQAAVLRREDPDSFAHCDQMVKEAEKARKKASANG